MLPVGSKYPPPTQVWSPHLPESWGAGLGGGQRQPTESAGLNTDPPNLKLLRVAKDTGAGVAEQGAGLPSFSVLCPRPLPIHPGAASPVMSRLI